MQRQNVTLVEVGPRDGLQNEAQLLSTEDKIELVAQLAAAGLERIEVASFVHPKRVPQMADAEAVVAGVKARLKGAEHRPTLLGLVLNRRGLDRALAAGVDEVGYVVVASDTFGQKNQGVTAAEALEVWRELAAAARAARVPASLTVAAAWGCPFEGVVPPAGVLEIAKAGLEAGPSEIGLADTIGVGGPREVSQLVQGVVEAAGDIPVRGHFHDTRNTGVANAWAAFEAGATRIDASVGGLGGCPFAKPTRPPRDGAPTAATGNVPTEDVLYAFSRSEIETGVSLEALLETSGWLSERLGRPLPSKLSGAGPAPHPRP